MRTSSGVDHTDVPRFETPWAETELHTVYFDLELRQDPDAIGGWDAARARGGVSIACVWDSTTGENAFYDDFALGDLAEHLERAAVVVTFNGKWFDLPLVEAHLGRSLCLRESIDLFALVKSALERVGKPWKGHGLGAIASRTLGMYKIGLGKRAPQLAQEGRIAELVTYCAYDVTLTRKLADFIRSEGYIIDADGERLELGEFLPPWWRRNSRNVQDIQEKACKNA